MRFVKGDAQFRFAAFAQRALVLAVLVGAAAGLAQAQGEASISGIVTDMRGSVVTGPGA